MPPMLVSLINKTAAMLVSQTSPVGVEACSYVEPSLVPGVTNINFLRTTSLHHQEKRL